MYIHCLGTKTININKKNKIKKQNTESTERHKKKHVTKWKTEKKCCSSYATSVPEKNKIGERKQLCLFWREQLEWGCRKGYDWWWRQIFNLGWQLSFCPSSPLCWGKSVFNKLLPRRLLCVQWDSFHNNLIKFHRPFCWRNERICPNCWIPRISTGIQPIHFANSYKFIWKHYSPVRLFHMSKRRESKPLLQNHRRRRKTTTTC